MIQEKPTESLALDCLSADAPSRNDGVLSDQFTSRSTGGSGHRREQCRGQLKLVHLRVPDGAGSAAVSELVITWALATMRCKGCGKTSHSTGTRICRARQLDLAHGAKPTSFDLHSGPSGRGADGKVLVVVAAYQLFDCLQAAIIGALRGYKDTQFPMWLSISAYWLVALTVGYMMGLGIAVFDLGLPGFFVGLGTGLLVVALVAAWRLNRVSQSEAMIKRLSEY